MSCVSVFVCVPWCLSVFSVLWGLSRDLNNGLGAFCMVLGQGCDLEAGVTPNRGGQPQGKGLLLWVWFCGERRAVQRSQGQPYLPFVTYRRVGGLSSIPAPHT